MSFKCFKVNYKILRGRRGSWRRQGEETEGEELEETGGEELEETEGEELEGERGGEGSVEGKDGGARRDGGEEIRQEYLFVLLVHMARAHWLLKTAIL